MSTLSLSIVAHRDAIRYPVAPGPAFYDHAEKLVNGRDIFWGEWKRPKAELITERLPFWPVCKSPRCIRCNPETATPYESVA